MATIEILVTLPCESVTREVDVCWLGTAPVIVVLEDRNVMDEMVTLTCVERLSIIHRYHHLPETYNFIFIAGPSDLPT